MISELQKLLDRNFIICYLLPVSIFMAVSFCIFKAFNIEMPNLFMHFNSDVGKLIGATIVGIGIWLLAVLLMALNREWIRILEGYGEKNPLNFLKKYTLKKYMKLNKDILEIESKIENLQKDEKNIDDISDELDKLTEYRVTYYPDDVEWILPTKFGNIIRSFEVYPRVMYGLDAIPGWNRLIALIPEQFLKVIESTEANVYFWTSGILVSILLIIEYLYIIIILGKGYWHSIWIPIILIISIFCSYSRANQAAIQWGEMVKAAFDLYINELFIKLSFISGRKKQEIWKDFSEAIIFRDPYIMPNRNFGKLNEG